MSAVPKLSIPAGTQMIQQFNAVTLHFMTEQEADAFARWIEWITSDEAKQIKTLAVEHMEETKQ